LYWKPRPRPLLGKERELCLSPSPHPYRTTLRMLSPLCIRSKARLMSSSGITWVMKLVDLDAAVHVPVHVLRQLRAATRAAERGAAPTTPGHQQERARVYLFAGAGDTDNDRLAPTLVRACQRLAHDVDVPMHSNEKSTPPSLNSTTASTML